MVGPFAMFIYVDLEHPVIGLFSLLLALRSKFYDFSVK